MDACRNLSVGGFIASGLRLPPLARIIDENSGDDRDDGCVSDESRCDTLSRRDAGDAVTGDVG